MQIHHKTHKTTKKHKTTLCVFCLFCEFCGEIPASGHISEHDFSDAFAHAIEDMSDCVRTEAEDVGVGYLLCRKTVAEMKEEDENVALSVFTPESAPQDLDQFVFDQIIRVRVEVLPPIPFLL